MNTKMYVGNLPYEVSESELRELFEAHGSVTDVHMVMDRDTGEWSLKKVQYTQLIKPADSEPKGISNPGSAV